MAFTKEQQKLYRDAKRKAANKLSREEVKHNNLAKLSILLYSLAETDSGKEFVLECVDLENLRNEGWSDILPINEEVIGKYMNLSHMSISRYLKELESLGYVKFIDKGKLKNAKYDSNCYIISYSNIEKDFSSELFDIDPNKVRFEYYSLLIKNDTNTIEFNNKCVKRFPLFKNISKEIEDLNKKMFIPEYEVNFLVENEDGDYIGGRYYNPICSSRNPERHEDSDRYDIVRKVFGVNKDTKIVEFDISSAQLRIIYDLTHKESFPKDKDMYFKLVDFISDISEEEFRKPINNKNEVTPRDIVKKEVQSILMNLSSVHYKQQLYNKDIYNLNGKMLNYKVDTIEKLFKMSYPEFLDRLKYSLYDLLSVYDFDENLRVILGKYYMKFEAIIYHYMNLEAYNKGIKQINVYDGFYYIDGTMTKESFHNLYLKAIQLTKELLKNNKVDLVKEFGKSFKQKYYKVKKPVYYKKQSTYNTNLQIPKQNSETKDNHYLEEEKINILKQLGVEEPYDEEEDF